MKDHTASIDTFLDSSLKACQKVYELLSSPLVEDDFHGDHIGAGGDLSLLIDIKAEKIFFDHFPSFTVFSEESGYFGTGDYKIILDPIDGSDNFVSNFPYYGASMALQYQDVTLAALVCNLANGDLFYKLGEAKAQKGSLFHDKLENLEKNPHAKVGIFEKSALFTKTIDKLIENKLKFRSPGAVALSLVYAFSAKYMIFLGSKRTFDIEAGLFITKDLCLYENEGFILLAQDEATLAEVKAIILEEKI